jgi:hypothetical protein
VTTEGYWAVEADQQWVTFDPIRGDGNGEFTMIVQGHEAEAERTANVTVKIDDSDVKKTFQITQDKVRAAFTIHVTSVFSEEAVGVHYFWDQHATPALYYKLKVIKPGTLRVQFDDSHIHTFLCDKEPGYFEFLGGDLENPIFAPTATVATDPTISDAYYAHVKYGGSDGKNQTGDIHALCPRDTPQNFTFHLTAGDYWTTHTLENTVTDETCGTDHQVDNGSFPISEQFELTITFTPDDPD